MWPSVRGFTLLTWARLGHSVRAMAHSKTTLDWITQIHIEFGRESDRAAGIVAVAMLDEALHDLFAGRLLPPLKPANSLLEGNRAPIGTFSVRIDAAHQLGFISTEMARDLHLMRKIRNDFSHHAQQVTFDTPSAKDRVKELTKQTVMFRESPELRVKVGAPGTRLDFLSVAQWILHSLRQKVERVVPVDSPKPEFGYRLLAELEQASQGIDLDAIE